MSSMLLLLRSIKKNNFSLFHRLIGFHKFAVEFSSPRSLEKWELTLNAAATQGNSSKLAQNYSRV